MPAAPRKGKSAKSAPEASAKAEPSPLAAKANAKIPREEEALTLEADILSQVRDVVFACDHEFRMIYWNKAAELQYGFSAIEVLGRKATDIIQYRWVKPEDEEACNRSLRTSGLWRGEVIQFNKKGEEIYVEGVVRVLNLPNRSGPIYLAINRDITERKRAEAAVRQAQAGLEARIRERTAELEEANRRLRAEVRERLSAEEALRESEQRLHSILDTSPSIVFLKDPEGRYLYVNPQFQKICHAPREEVIGKTDRELFPKKQAEVFRANDLHVLNARSSLEFEEVALQRDGPHTSLVTKFPLVDTKGEIYALGGIVTDITERIVAEQALCEANAILKKQAQLLNLAPDAIIVRGLNGAITFWNQGAEKTYGWDRQEALGRTMRTLLQTEFPIPAEEIDRKIFNEGSWDGELTHLRRDGKRITVASRQVLQQDEQGQPTGILVINRDVSERKQAELALREVQERFRLLVENVQDYAIFMLDTQGRILSWNPGAERIKGYQAEEIIGEHVSRIYTPEEIAQDHPERLLKAAQAEGQTREEGWRVRKDGTRFWADVVVTALRDEKGDLRGFGKVVRDLTERKQAELALRELSGRLLQKQDEERRTLARELHDSTSPSFTMLLSKLYQVRKQIPDMNADGVEKLSDSIALAESLAREITTASYLLHPPLLESQGFNAALGWYVEGYVRRTGIRVETDLPGSSLKLPKETEMAFFRIVQEALTNILRHSGAAAAKVRLSSNGKQVTLEVSDQGRGIPAHDLERWRAGDITKLGAGMAGMRERMRQLGGHLEIHSNTHGTVIRAVLPSPP